MASEAEEVKVQEEEAKAQEESEAEEQKASEEEEQHEEENEPRDVASSMVSSWGYDESNEQLEVVFQNGHEESYPCSPEQWAEAKSASSAGKWMHENVL